MSKLTVVVFGVVGLVGVVGACSSSSVSQSVGSSSAALKLDTSGWTYVFGLHALVHPSCVHQIPDGTMGMPDGTVRRRDGTVIASYEGCAYPPEVVESMGWVMDSIQIVPGITGGNFYSSMINQWTVPLAPPPDLTQSPNGQLIGVFSAWETWDAVYGPPTDGGQYSWHDVAIVQPVLQWGINAGEEGTHQVWQILDESVVGTGPCPGVSCNVYETYPQNVGVGDTIVGILQEADNVIEGPPEQCNPSNTLIQIEDTTLHISSTMFAPWGQWVTANSGVLEGHNIGGCGDFSPGGSISFSAPNPLLVNNQNVNNGCGANSMPGTWTAENRSVLNGYPNCSWAPTLGVDGLGDVTLRWTP